MRYILWVGALLGACDDIQDGGQYGRHLGFCQKLKIMKKWRKLEIVNARHVKYDIIKHFAAFYAQFVLFSPKKSEKHTVLPKNGLNHLLLITS